MAILSFVHSVELAIVATIAYNLFLTIYRLYLHPLSKFPGSKLAAASHWYELYYDVGKNGQFVWEMERMHEKYGPIVRINPDELHIKDSEYYDEIYAGSNKKRDKYDKWIMMAGAPKSAFSTPEHDIHRKRRGALNPFFAKRSVVRLEPAIWEKVGALCSRLAADMRKERVVDMNTLYTAFSLDVITEYGLGKSYDYLTQPDDTMIDKWRACMTDIFENAAFRRAVPWLTTILQTLPSSYILRLMPSMEVLITYQHDIIKQVESLVSSKESGKAGQEKNSIFQALLDNEDLPPEERSVQRLADEGEILLAAATESTSRTLTYTSFYIVHTPGVLQKLRNELKTAMPKFSDSPAWTDLEKLPYLTAVISEGLRLSFGISTRLPRVAHEALHYGDWIIPPRKTPVSQTTYFISTDPSIFPEPFQFKPERWLQKEGKQRLDRYMTSFSKGTRGCVGINLAYAELYLALAGVFRRFDLEAFDTTIEDVQMARDTFVPSPKVGSKGVRMLVKREVE